MRTYHWHTGGHCDEGEGREQHDDENNPQSGCSTLADLFIVRKAWDNRWLEI